MEAPEESIYVVLVKEFAFTKIDVTVYLLL